MRMKIPRSVKSILRWIIPWAVYESAGKWRGERARRVRLTSEEADLVARNAELGGRHAGERCFILGSGPSIGKQDLTLLTGEMCISMGNFFVHPVFSTIVPRYHCIVPHHKPITEAAWDAWLAEMAKSMKNTTMFFGLTDVERVHRGGSFDGYDVRFIPFDFKVPESAPAPDDIDLTKPVWSPSCVTIMALQVAIYLGFSKIYLLGCDHDWVLHIGESRHFYDESEHALCRAGYSEWFLGDFANYCSGYVETWRQYKLVRGVAEEWRISIYNATAGGVLDVFPRAKYETLFSTVCADH